MIIFKKKKLKKYIFDKDEKYEKIYNKLRNSKKYRIHKSDEARWSSIKSDNTSIKTPNMSTIKISWYMLSSTQTWSIMSLFTHLIRTSTL